MAAQKLVVSLLTVTSLIAVACFAGHRKPENTVASSEVKFTNNLMACVNLIPGKTLEVNGLLLLETNWQNQKSVGECGCKSALMNYSVNVQNGTKTGKIITEAVISSLEKKEHNFVLNADASIKYNDNYEITISCKNPE